MKRIAAVLQLKRYFAIAIIALKCSDRIVFTSGKVRIADGITLYADYNAAYVTEPDPAGLQMMQDGALVTEDFRHIRRLNWLRKEDQS